MIPVLVLTAHFRDLDVTVGAFRVSWIEWLEKKENQLVTFGHEVGGRPVLTSTEDLGEHDPQWVTDVLTGLIDLLHGPSGMTMGVVEIPAEWLDSAVLSAEDVEGKQDLWSRRPSDLFGSWGIGDGPVEETLKLLPRVVAATGGDHSAPLVSAILYYKASTAEFAFLGDGVGWAMSDEGREPETRLLERTQMEQAFQNAYKAFEALVGGEPGRDDRRLRQRLRDMGVDPDAPIGPRSHPEPLLTVLRRVGETRDARAAHGGRTSAAARGISPFELMEAQFAVEDAILQALYALPE